MGANVGRMMAAGLAWISLTLAAHGETQLPGAGAPGPPPEAVVGELPFVPGFPTRIMVDLAPEGQRPFVMMLDTGASTSVMTPPMARSLGVSVRAAKDSPYRKATRLGRDLQFYVDVRTSDSGSKTGFEYGLLGGEFLDDYVLELDYPGERVRFLDPGRYRVPESTAAADEAVLPFKRSGTRIVVDIAVDGKEGRVLLDTGAPDSAILSGKLARRLGIDLTTLEDFGEVGTVLGPMRVLLLETGSFRFGGFELGAHPVLVAPRGWYNQGTSSDSVIGYDVLRQFVLRIDYKRKRIWLKRTGDPRVTFQGTDWALVQELGAFFTPIGPGRFWIWRVRGGGWADGHGFRESDVVVGPPTLEVEEIRFRVDKGHGVDVARGRGEEALWVQIGAGAPASP